MSDLTQEELRQCWAEIRLKALGKFIRLIPVKGTNKCKIVHKRKIKNWFLVMDSEYGGGDV